MQEIWQNLVSGMLATTWLEFVAVIFGILSVVYSRAENILVYPTGLINTTLYIYLSVQAGLYAEASVNGYYTIMSVAGWIWWTQKRGDGRRLRISGSSATDWRNALLFFGIFWIVSIHDERKLGLDHSRADLRNPNVIRPKGSDL